MSTGRQGFEASRSSCISKGIALALGRSRVDPLAEAVEQGAQLGVERRLLALGGATDAERPHQPVDRQPLLPGHLGDATGDDTAVEVDLPEPVLAVAEALGEPEVGGAARPRRAEPPSGRAAPAPAPRGRQAQSSPSASAVAAAPASARRSPRLRRQGRCPRSQPSTLLARDSSCKPTGWPARPRAASGAPFAVYNHIKRTGTAGLRREGAFEPAFGLELLRGGPPSPSPRRGGPRAGRRPRPRRAGPRGSARRAPGRRARRRSRISRCSTYSASFAAGSSIQGPWPGQINSIGSACIRRSESM